MLLSCGLPELYIDDIKARAVSTDGLLLRLLAVFCKLLAHQQLCLTLLLRVLVDRR